MGLNCVNACSCEYCECCCRSCTLKASTGLPRITTAAHTDRGCVCVCALLSGPIESHKFMACDPIRYGGRKEVQAFKETSDWGRWIERNRNLVYFGLVCVTLDS